MGTFKKSEKVKVHAKPRGDAMLVPMTTTASRRSLFWQIEQCLHPVPVDLAGVWSYMRVNCEDSCTCFYF